MSVNFIFLLFLLGIDYICLSFSFLTLVLFMKNITKLEKKDNPQSTIPSHIGSASDFSLSYKIGTELVEIISVTLIFKTNTPKANAILSP